MLLPSLVLLFWNWDHWRTVCRRNSLLNPSSEMLWLLCRAVVVNSKPFVQTQGVHESTSYLSTLCQSSAIFFYYIIRLKPIHFGHSSKRGTELSSYLVVSWICPTGLVLLSKIRRVFSGERFIERHSTHPWILPCTKWSWRWLLGIVLNHGISTRDTDTR